MTAPASEGYRKGIYTTAVLEAAEAAGIRLSALTVLYYLCRWSKKDGPLTDQARWQIEQGCGLCDKTVKAALRRLRDAGVLVPVARKHGGKIRGGQGVGVVYRLAIIGPGRGEKTSPLPVGQDVEEGGKKTPGMGGKKLPERGEKNSPLNRGKRKQEREEGGASRAGRNSRPLDAGASPGPRAGAQYEPDELRRLSEETSRYGYSEAKRRQDARLAERGAG